MSLPLPRAITLGELLAAAGIESALSPATQLLRITGVCDDSRAVAAGDLYLALRGSRVDGRGYIADAIARGAAAVLAEADDGAAVDSRVGNVPVLAVRGLRALAGPVAAAFFGEPSRTLRVVAITGTNGKTTASWLVAGALARLGRRAAVLGTLGAGAPDARLPLANTTPGAVELQRLLAGLRDAGFQDVAMEASSIGLDQQRMAGTQVAAALFTNLSRDHLDYHGSMEAYAEAKARLFAWPGLAAAVLNGDDAQALRWLAEGRVGAARVYTYGSAGRGHDIELLGLSAAATGSRLALRVLGTPVTLDTRLLGRFNAANLMAVIGALLALDFALADILAVLPELAAPPGRMESLGGGELPLCVVDYAHTPDALEKVLGVLRERGGRLWCVFGCGGDRDRGKRPQMGEVAARLADRVVVTADNPRSESVDSIIADILAGIPAGAAVQVEPDRARAIALAVAGAGNGDAVLVAGKGHEDYQEVGGVRLPFSDTAAVRAALAARAGGAACA